MSRYMKEEKIAAILAVEAGEGVKSVARRLQINREVLRHDVGMYREHGVEGLSGEREKWTADGKLAILEYMYRNHLSCKQTSIICLEMGATVPKKRSLWIGAKEKR